MQIDLIPWNRLDERLRRNWSELITQQNANPSLSPYWVDAIVSSHGVSDETMVAVLRHGAQSLGFLPVYSSHERIFGINVRVLAPTSNLVSYHAQVVASDGYEAELIDGALNHVFEGRWDLVRFLNVLSGSPSAEAIERLVSKHQFRMIKSAGESSPYLPIETKWEDYCKTLGSKFRSNLKRAARRTAETGTIELQWFEQGNVEQLLEAMFEIERRSWKASAGVAITDREEEIDYHRRLLTLLSERRQLLCAVLYCDGRPIAYVLCCQIGGWVGQLKTSYDASYPHVGMHLVELSIERAFLMEASEYDFLGQPTDSKLRWTSLLRDHVDYCVYARTIAGQTVFGAKSLVSRGRQFISKSAT